MQDNILVTLHVYRVDCVGSGALSRPAFHMTFRVGYGFVLNMAS